MLGLRPPRMTGGGHSGGAALAPPDVHWTPSGMMPSHAEVRRAEGGGAPRAAPAAGGGPPAPPRRGPGPRPPRRRTPRAVPPHRAPRPPPGADTHHGGGPRALRA